MPIRVKHVRLQSVLGIKDIEFSPGALTVLEGGNGVGKTSALEALKSALGGGQDASLLRMGDTAGEVVILLEDGTEIVEKLSTEGVERSVRHPSFGELKRPSTYLKKLTDALAVNPLEFLLAPPARRAEWLLEILPISVTDDDLRTSGVQQIPPASANGLERIDVARKTVYDLRTGVNRAAKEKRSTVTTLRASLPETTTDAPNVKALRKEKDDLAAERSARVEAIKGQAGRPVGVQADFTDLVPEVAEWLGRELEQLRVTATRKSKAIRDAERDQLAAVTEEYGPRLEDLTGRIGQAEEQARRATADGQTRQLADRHEQEAQALEAESARHTFTIEALDELRTRALARLPIAGVEVREGQVYVGGILFDRLNHARRVELALSIAALRAGDLRLVLVDGLECLDPQTFAAFEQAVPASGLQFVVSRVTEGPLVVRHVAAAVA